MTVQEFMRAYVSAGSKIQGLIVQKNSGDGKLRVLYGNSSGYDERYIRPDVRQEVVWKWGIDSKLKRVWVTVREEKNDAD